jgi:hypothetical protein
MSTSAMPSVFSNRAAAIEENQDGTRGSNLIPPPAGLSQWGPSDAVSQIRRKTEKLKPPEPVYVRVKASLRIGSVQTFSGLRITIGKDRTVRRESQLLDPGGLDLA